MPNINSLDSTASKNGFQLNLAALMKPKKGVIK